MNRWVIPMLRPQPALVNQPEPAVMAVVNGRRMETKFRGNILLISHMTITTILGAHIPHLPTFPSARMPVGHPLTT